MTAPVTETPPAPSITLGVERYYGKYRGTVSDNNDPKKIGRVRARVPEVLGTVDSGWALPCAPYTGDSSGAYHVPAQGAGVWIEFEAGDPSRPIWVGGWWQGQKLPKDEGGTEVTPDVKILRSEQGLMVALHDDNKSIAVSDSNGSNLLHIEVDQGQVTVKAGTKVVVEAPQIELVQNDCCIPKVLQGRPQVLYVQLRRHLSQLLTLLSFL